MTPERLAEELMTFSHLLRPGRRPDMTPEQYWLMRYLRANGPLSIGELANALNVTTGSMTVACKRLEKAGLLTRERQADDERIVQVALTEQGRIQINEWLQRKREPLARLLNVLDQHEQEVLQELIERLLVAAEAQGFGEEKK